MELAFQYVVSGGAVLALAALLWRALLDRHVVQEYQCGLHYRNGRFIRVLGPGGYRMLRRRNAVTLVDKRRRIVTVPGQEILTADQVGLKISLAVSYTVSDPVKAVHDVEDFYQGLYVAAQLVLRKAVSTLTLDQLLEQRMELGRDVFERLQVQFTGLGLSLDSVEVKDVMLPAELRKSYSEVVRARKDGQAALERARGETASLRSLANAARMLDGNPALLRLRTLQVLESSPVGHTVVLSPDGQWSALKQSNSAPNTENQA